MLSTFAVWLGSQNPQGGPARRMYSSTPLTLFACMRERVRLCVRLDVCTVDAKLNSSVYAWHERTVCV